MQSKHSLNKDFLKIYTEIIIIIAYVFSRHRITEFILKQRVAYAEKFSNIQLFS